MKNNINVIAISGRAGSGKNTVAKIIQGYSCNLDRNEIHHALVKYQNEPQLYYIDRDWDVVSFAGKLKQIASILTGIPIEKFEDQEFKQTKLGPEWDFMTVRSFLQKLGTDAIRNNLHEKTWLNAFWSDFNPKVDKWVVSDCRFENEAISVLNSGGIVLRLKRNSEIESNHPSETALDNFYKFSYIIDNRNYTLLELIDAVGVFCEKFNLANY